ncbi:hypothetical protein EOE18_04180 [Novosphingobium umbonatum]|uniref:Uncharacterized protein n=1 Tax=Novosphingobium umbonatum TaxID=1908524 RepID=A0A3S2UWW1_9SPHN|nr:hypothetical protein [Novosphingobium umbonatum]RVU07148.1 hypothetical protein EOE18_04180 [Novosphingobium umbonatum]
MVQELGIAKLRLRRIKGFPWLIIDTKGAEVVGVWRILHAKQDRPALLGEDGAGAVAVGKVPLR